MILALVAALLGAGPKTDASWSTEPFKWTEGNLPPHYRGVDQDRLFDRLTKIYTKKGEFESTKDFRTRIDRAKSQKLFGAITSESLLAFDVPCAPTYNPDTKCFGVVVKVRHDFYFVKLQSGNSVCLRTSPIKTTRFGSDLRETQEGVMREVVSEAKLSKGISTLNADEFGWNPEVQQGNSEGTETDVCYETQAIGTADPVQLKKNLRALAVVQLEYPFALRTYRYSNPTLDKPEDIFIAKFMFVGRIRQIVFYDQRSGKVLNRILPKTPGKKVE